MKKLALLSFLLILVFFNSVAQNNLQTVFEINQVTNNRVLMHDSTWQMLEDKTGKLTINQVSQQPLAYKFHKNTGFDYKVETYWIRYRLKNNLKSDVTISIGSNAVYYDLYIAGDSSKWIHHRTGHYVPWSQRDGEKRFASIPVTIAPGKEILVYKRIVYDFKIFQPITFTTAFWFVDINSDADFFDNIRNTFLFGILFLTAIIHLFFFGVVRERVYLFYAMAMFFASLLYFFSPLFHLFFREFPKAYNYSLPFLITFLLFFLIHTFRYFLRTFELYPLWDKFLNFFGLIPFLALLNLLFFGKPLFIQRLLYILLLQLLVSPG